MNLYKYQYIAYIMLLFFAMLLSCEENADWQLEPQHDNSIVVDGLITNEMKSHIVKITKPIKELNATAITISGATVNIKEGDITYLLKETPFGSGIYRTDSTMQGVVGKTYTLTINYNYKTYIATTYMLPITPFTPLSYQPTGNDNLFQIAWVNETYGDEPAMWELLFDWSQVSGYSTLDTTLTKKRLLFYTFPSIDVSQAFAPQKENIEFPKGTIIIEKKYSLTPEHSEFLRALLSETEWRGGVFDVAAANLPTNLSFGAIGFFGASTILSDTIIVE